jgi:hypothetical protein
MLKHNTKVLSLMLLRFNKFVVLYVQAYRINLHNFGMDDLFYYCHSWGVENRIVYRIYGQTHK